MSESSTPAAPAATMEVLQALRAHTAERHGWVDSHAPLSVPAPALGDYAAHLRLLLRWLGPLEDWLGGFHDGPQDQAVLAPVRYSARIRADLAACPPAAGEAAAAAADSRWSGPGDAAYRWGLCYVIEGSQLGGAVLYRRLAEPLAPHPLGYLRGDAAGPGPRWQGFIRALRAAVTESGAIELACRGAADAFDALIDIQRGAGV